MVFRVWEFDGRVGARGVEAGMAWGLVLLANMVTPILPTGRGSGWRLRAEIYLPSNIDERSVLLEREYTDIDIYQLNYFLACRAIRRPLCPPA